MSYSSMLFALLSILEAGSISDTPLIMQFIVFCHLQNNSVLLQHHLLELCVPLMESRWDVQQMRLRAAGQPIKRKKKQRKKGRRWRHTAARQSRPHHAEQLIWAYRGTKKADRLHVFWCISTSRLHNAIDEYQCWLVCLHSCWVTVLPSSNCTALRSATATGWQSDKPNCTKPVTLWERTVSLGSKAVIPSYCKGEERRALVAGAARGTDGTNTMPQLRQQLSDTGRMTA